MTGPRGVGGGRGRALWGVLLSGALLAAPGAAAQTGPPPDLVARGVRAYEEVELAAAASWLRRALAERLSTSDQIRALTYLGATEVVRGPQRRDSAVAAFRRLLLLDPRQRPDGLVFPPAVLGVFDAVRRATKAVLVVPRAGDERGGFVAAVYGTSSHELEVRLAREDGVVVRTLYVGPVGDSMEVRWDGLDGAGGYVASGRYTLSLASRPSVSGGVARLVLLPLEAELVVPEMLPLPPPLADSLLLPETTSRGRGRRSLAIGLVASGAALALPSLIADGSKPSQARFAVAGAVSVAGIVGFLTGHGRPLAANVATNQARRAEWQRRLAAVTAENEQRRRAVRLTVRAGTPAIIERGGEEP